MARQVVGNRNISAEIRMLAARHAAVCAVEGDDDIRCYRDLFNSSVFFMKCYGKQYALDAITSLKDDDQITKCISIVDADYDSLLEIPNNSVKTDYVDLEAFGIWLARDCFESQLSQYLNYKKLQNDGRTISEIVDIAILRAHDLGAIRLFNHKSNDVVITFTSRGNKKYSNVNFTKVENIETTNEQDGCESIFKRISILNDDLNEEYAKYLEAVLKIRSEEEAKSLCKGDDVILALVTILKHLKYVTKDLTPTIASNALRGCITPILKQTGLYEELKNSNLKDFVV